MIIDLEKNSGLPISVGEDYRLIFRDPLPEVTPSIRKLSDMRPVLKDETATTNIANEEMYYMYRDVHLPSDEETLRTNNIRYDITVIPPGKIGEEFNKTVGHYHPNDPKGFAYPEVYEVLHGQALFVIQKTGENPKDVHSIICIRASTGEKVIYPPYYGHIIVNVGSDVLVTANLVADKFDSLYQPIADNKGMAYYVVPDADRGFAFVRNTNYPNSPSVREITTDFIRQFPIAKDGPMYSMAVKNPKIAEFLNIPEKYAVELSTITS